MTDEQMRDWKRLMWESADEETRDFLREFGKAFGPLTPKSWTVDGEPVWTSATTD